MPVKKFVYNFLFQVYEPDDLEKVKFEKKYTTINDMINDVGVENDIYCRNTVYRIIKGHLVNKHKNIKITKIKEKIPHIIEKRIIFLE